MGVAIVRNQVAPFVSTAFLILLTLALYKAEGRALDLIFSSKIVGLLAAITIAAYVGVFHHNLWPKDRDRS
jgi:hypothetical protein